MAKKIHKDDPQVLVRDLADLIEKESERLGLNVVARVSFWCPISNISHYANVFPGDPDTARGAAHTLLGAICMDYEVTTAEVEDDDDDDGS